MRRTNLATTLLFAVAMLAGAIVGSALRSGMRGSLPVQAGEPILVTSIGGP